MLTAAAAFFDSSKKNAFAPKKQDINKSVCVCLCVCGVYACVCVMFSSFFKACTFEVKVRQCHTHSFTFVARRREQQHSSSSSSYNRRRRQQQQQRQQRPHLSFLASHCESDPVLARLPTWSRVHRFIDARAARAHMDYFLDAADQTDQTDHFYGPWIKRILISVIQNLQQFALDAFHCAFRLTLSLLKCLWVSLFIYAYICVCVCVPAVRVRAVFVLTHHHHGHNCFMARVITYALPYPSLQLPRTVCTHFSMNIFTQLCFYLKVENCTEIPCAMCPIESALCVCNFSQSFHCIFQPNAPKLPDFPTNCSQPTNIQMRFQAPDNKLAN